MGLDLLDTPIRLTWDFPDTSGGQKGVDLPAVANCLVEAGVFFVTLQGTPLLHPATAEVLNLLSGRCQLLVTCRGETAELDRLAQLNQSGYQLLLDVSAFLGAGRELDSARLAVVVQTLRQRHLEPLLSLTPLRNNLRNIPDLLRFCRDQKITKFKLSNAHIGDSFEEYSPADLPRWQDLDSFRKLWTDFSQEGCPLPILEIHDLFLWEIMTPGEEQHSSEYGGCQAGNSLAHIDSQGFVYPCAAWPQKLGKLPLQSLSEIWRGAARRAVREQVAVTPAGCCGCRDRSRCFGGCRGLSLALNQSEGQRDLMCSGPR